MLTNTFKFWVLIIMGLALLFGGCGKKEQSGETATKEKPAVSRLTDVTIHGTVEAVNRENKSFTLKDAEGDMQELTVGDAVQNFDEIQAGDSVTVTFMESFVAQVLPEGEAPPESKNESLALTPQGKEKGIVTLGTQQTVVTVESIDLANREITVKGPAGNVVALPVKEDVKNFDQLKVGDKVFMKFTQAMAVSIKKD